MGLKLCVCVCVLSFVLLPGSVDLLVQSHGEGHTQELQTGSHINHTATTLHVHLYVFLYAHAHTSYLYDQNTHGNGSQQVFIVIQPFLHLLIATLTREKHIILRSEKGHSYTCRYTWIHTHTPWWEEEDQTFLNKHKLTCVQNWLVALRPQSW